jgi:hypothetical protein
MHIKEKKIFKKKVTGHKWLMPTWEAETRFEAKPGKYFVRPYLERNHYKKKRAGGVTHHVGPELNPRTAKSKKKKKRKKSRKSILAKDCEAQIFC